MIEGAQTEGVHHPQGLLREALGEQCCLCFFRIGPLKGGQEDYRCQKGNERSHCTVLYQGKRLEMSAKLWAMIWTTLMFTIMLVLTTLFEPGT